MTDSKYDSKIYGALMLNNNGRFRLSAILPIFLTVPGFDTKKNPLNTMKLQLLIIFKVQVAHYTI